MLQVFRTAFFQQLVHRRAGSNSLEQFLKFSLRVDFLRFGGDGGQILRGYFEDEELGRLESPIDIDSSHKGLEGITERGGPVAASACLLSASHHQMLPKTQGLGMFLEGHARDQTGADLGQLTFREIRKP